MSRFGIQLEFIDISNPSDVLEYDDCHLAIVLQQIQEGIKPIPIHSILRDLSCESTSTFF